jgi:nucleotide-binding universal stress UspA family protein
MYETVLLPTDGSRPADYACDYAFDLAERYDATLHAVYVVDTTAFAVPDVDTSIIIQGFEREGQEALDAIATAAEGRDIPVKTAILHGSPADEVLDYAEDHDIDCIVMGTHGRRGLSRMLLGSTTSRVLRAAEMPVLVVRAPEQ